MDSTDRHLILRSFFEFFEKQEALPPRSPSTNRQGLFDAKPFCFFKETMCVGTKGKRFECGY